MVSTIAAVVLAAGSSQRMDSINKLHLPIDGVALIRRSVKILVESMVADIVVVLGHEHEATQALIDDLPVSCVYNESYRAGQMTSVHCGLKALQHDYDAVVVALGDQPALRSTDVDTLITAFKNRDGGEVVMPTYNGMRGNPIVISANCRRDILGGTKNLGCRKFIDKNPELVCSVEMSDPAVIIDLDTRLDYENFCANAIDRPDNYRQQVS